MALFPELVNPSINLLPCDGIVHYHGLVFSEQQANDYFEVLNSTIPWQHDQLRMYGRLITTSRKVAWFGDSPFSYTYSGIPKQALIWTEALVEIKQLIEDQTGLRFNSCLMNLYADGDSGMSWHSDDEATLIPNGAIASVSLGATRKFVFKHKRNPIPNVPILLEHGSLLVMQGTTQSHWLHSITKSKKVSTPRINLTFRTMRTSTN